MQTRPKGKCIKKASGKTQNVVFVICTIGLRASSIQYSHSDFNRKRRVTLGSDWTKERENAEIFEIPRPNEKKMS